MGERCTCGSSCSRTSSHTPRFCDVRPGWLGTADNCQGYAAAVDAWDIETEAGKVLLTGPAAMAPGAGGAEGAVSQGGGACGAARRGPAGHGHQGRAAGAAHCHLARWLLPPGGGARRRNEALGFGLGGDNPELIPGMRHWLVHTLHSAGGWGSHAGRGHQSLTQDPCIARYFFAGPLLATRHTVICRC